MGPPPGDLLQDLSSLLPEAKYSHAPLWLQCSSHPTEVRLLTHVVLLRVREECARALARAWRLDATSRSPSGHPVPNSTTPQALDIDPVCD